MDGRTRKKRRRGLESSLDLAGPKAANSIPVRKRPSPPRSGGCPRMARSAFSIYWLGDAGGGAPAPYKGIGRRSRGIVAFGGCGGRSHPTEGVQGGVRREFSVFACPGVSVRRPAAAAPLHADAFSCPGRGDAGPPLARSRVEGGLGAYFWDMGRKKEESGLSLNERELRELTRAKPPIDTFRVPNLPPFRVPNLPLAWVKGAFACQTSHPYARQTSHPDPYARQTSHPYACQTSHPRGAAKGFRVPNLPPFARQTSHPRGGVRGLRVPNLPPPRAKPPTYACQTSHL